MKNLTLYFSFLLLSFTFIFSACSTSRETADGGPAAPGDPEEVLATEEARALQQLLDETRSSLADLEESEQLEVPPTFTQAPSANSSANGNPYQGYRIQLISTRNVQEADTISNQFHEWLESKSLGYNAKAYIFFKQPYYRVRVGDFQNKDRAANFTRLIKQRYPDAWVVPDHIVPANVPSEDVNFSTEKESSDS